VTKRSGVASVDGSRAGMFLAVVLMSGFRISSL